MWVLGQERTPAIGCFRVFGVGMVCDMGGEGGGGGADNIFTRGVPRTVYDNTA